MPALTLKVFLRDLERFGWKRRENEQPPYWYAEEITRGAERIRLVPLSQCEGPIGMYYFEYRGAERLEHKTIQATAQPWINKYSQLRLPNKIDTYLQTPRWSPPERNLHLWLCSEYFPDRC